MEIASLSTEPFSVTAPTYLGLWLRVKARSRWPIVALISAAIIVAGAADLRLAIAAAMLGAVSLPMTALLVWDKLMQRAGANMALHRQQVLVDDSCMVHISYFAPGSDEPCGKASHPLDSARRISGYLLISIGARHAPIAVPADAIKTLEIKPETFD